MLVTEAGLYLPELELHLDPKRAVPRAFVSHAHADHAQEDALRGGEILATPETLALVAARRAAALPGAQPVAWGGVREIPMGTGRTARLRVEPAGHMLGAAQLVIDHPGGRLVYTGDYRSGPGGTHAPGAPVPCDELVVESTFALPIFRFPERSGTIAALASFCREAIGKGQTPVLLGYSLGKAQELARGLIDAGVPVVAHGAAYRMCVAYEALGVALGTAEGALRPYAEAPQRGRREAPLGAALLVPPSAYAHPMVRRRKDAVVAYVSGWARIDANVERYRADRGFVLSDHADHDDLMATVRATGARRVYTTLGDAEALAELLRPFVEAIPLASESLDVAEEPPPPATERA